MAENVSNELLLETLKAIQARLQSVAEDVGELKRRMTSLEASVALLHGDFAGQSGRIDRIEQRLDRIEKRLGLVDA